MENVNGSEIKTKIRAIFNQHDNTRKGRMETLDEISELGKEVLDSLNTMDKSVSEIADDFDDCVAEFEKMQNELDADIAQSDKMSKNLEDLNPRIAELEGKIKNGEELTEEEAEELRILYAQKEGITEDSETLNKNIQNLSGKMNTVSGKLSNYQNVLDDVKSKMDDYAEAGTEIKKSANEYGKKNMDSEKAMNRNETSWWNFIGKRKSGATSAGTVGSFFLSASVPGSIELGAMLGASIDSVSGDTQMEKYTEKAGLTEAADQTFYSKDTGFVTEYEALEKKGGNQIGGKMKKATAKTYSYGSTIESASKIVKGKAEEAQNSVNNTEADLNINDKDKPEE